MKPLKRNEKTSEKPWQVVHVQQKPYLNRITTNRHNSLDEHIFTKNWFLSYPIDRIEYDYIPSTRTPVQEQMLSTYLSSHNHSKLCEFKIAAVEKESLGGHFPEVGCNNSPTLNCLRNKFDAVWKNISTSHICVKMSIPLESKSSLLSNQAITNVKGWVHG